MAQQQCETPKDSSLSYEEISQPYFFESDHVALKENEDYRNLLQIITLLESQRQLAAKDIETLQKAQSQALEDPLQFVEKLQRGKDVGLPRPQKIPSLPEVMWKKYTNNVDFSAFGSKRHMTRNKRNEQETGGDAMKALKSKLMEGFETAPSMEIDPSVTVVRGRAKDKNKPETFNKLWTEEEQQRLERLLIQYPPEEVESRRWAKIADALGNRTPVQVASRVQKYFVRLAKEGLPVPGRMPNLAAHTQRGTHRHHRYRHYHNMSTMLQSHVPPVWMGEDGEESGINFFGSGATHSSNYAPDEMPFMSDNNSQKDDSSDEDDEDIPPYLKDTPEFKELQKLKQIRREKLAQERRALTRHIGYKCDNCGCEPIIGTRWHCIDCPTELSYDFCDNCSEVPFQQDKHDSTHRLQPVTQACLDFDYMSFTKNDYNYLDSNYMPAS